MWTWSSKFSIGASARNARNASAAAAWLILRIDTRGRGQERLPTVIAAKVKSLSVAVGVESGCFVNGHSADRIFGHRFRFDHGCDSFLSCREVACLYPTFALLLGTCLIATIRARRTSERAWVRPAAPWGKTLPRKRVALRRKSVLGGTHARAGRSWWWRAAEIRPPEAEVSGDVRPEKGKDSGAAIGPVANLTLMSVR